MKIPYLIAACIIGFFSLSCGLSAKEVMNSIAGYTFGDTIPGKQTKIQFRLKKPFLEFEQGIVHVNPKTRKIEAIELWTTLGKTIPKIPVKKSVSSLGNYNHATAHKDAEEEKKIRQELAINRTFSLALAALEKRYNLGRGLEINNSYKLELKPLPDNKLIYSPLHEVIEHLNFTTLSGNGGFVIRAKKSSLYGVDTWEKTWRKDGIYAYGPSAAQRIRQLHFCIDKQTLRIVIRNYSKGDEPPKDFFEASKATVEEGSADVL